MKFNLACAELLESESGDWDDYTGFRLAKFEESIRFFTLSYQGGCDSFMLEFVPPLLEYRGDDIVANPSGGELAGRLTSLAWSRLINLKSRPSQAAIASPTTETDETVNRNINKQRRRKPLLTDRQKWIREAIRKGLEGEDYCRFLDGYDLEPPQAWQNKGCKKSYADAYKYPRWRQSVFNEKSNHARALSKENGSAAPASTGK